MSTILRMFSAVIASVGRHLLILVGAILHLSTLRMRGEENYDKMAAPAIDKFMLDDHAV